MSRKVYFIHNVHMGASHESLIEQAEQEGIDVSKLPQGTFVFFLNGAHTAFKLMPNPRVVLYYRHPRGRIQFEALTRLPNYFDAEHQDGGYTEALTETLKARCAGLLEERKKKAEET